MQGSIAGGVAATSGAAHFPVLGFGVLGTRCPYHWSPADRSTPTLCTRPNLCGLQLTGSLHTKKGGYFLLRLVGLSLCGCLGGWVLPPPPHPTTPYSQPVLQSAASLLPFLCAAFLHPQEEERAEANAAAELAGIQAERKAAEERVAAAEKARKEADEHAAAKVPALHLHMV